MLFVTEGRREAVQQALQDGHAEITALVAALQDDGFDDNELSRHVQAVCRGWLADDRAVVLTAIRALCEYIRETDALDLGRGAQTFALVLAYDFAGPILPQNERAAVLELLRDLAVSFLSIRHGNPHIVTNNWYMITHGACLLACMAAHGEMDTRGEMIDLAALERWALHRCEAFCQHFGNAGLYHEGSGYILYTMSMLAPVCVALRNRRGIDLTELHPGLRYCAHSVILGMGLCHDDAKMTACMLDWNDSGRNAGTLNPLLPLALLSPDDYQIGLLQYLARTIVAPKPMKCQYRGLALGLALWPVNLHGSEAQTTAALPRWTHDYRHGFGYWRSDWNPAPAATLGWYARTTHASPGHSQEDAGSLRLMANGTNWICGGGQNRAKAIWQSVLTHVDAAQTKVQKGHAYVFSRSLEETCGCIGMEMRHVLGAYSERYLAWNSSVGYPICLAVLDLVSEHCKPPRAYTWNLSFPRELACAIDSDGAGFSLRHPKAGVLRARFLLDQPERLTHEVMPASTRTYSGGHRVDYPGDGFIAATFGQREALRILVAMAVSPADEDQAPAGMRLDGRAIVLGNGVKWQDPFASAILPQVDLASCRTNLQLYPAG